MQPLKPLFLTFTLIALASWPAVPLWSANETAARATGAVSGRVQNVVTGLYLNQARISVQGTNQTVFTDQFGQYRLVNLPGGPVVLEVFYTDLDPQSVSVVVVPNQTIERDVGLTSAARYGQNAAVVQLDAFVVATDRETDAQAIAANEQRFAKNIKNVVSTESLGDVLGNNVGEFMKMLPGVFAGYSGSEIVGVSVRGFSGAQTTVSSDGIALASAEFASTRNFNMLNTSLNDVSRIEVTKVPTPSHPADSMGGTVNMVSKSAFERSKAQLRFGLSMVGNSTDFHPFKKTPDILDDRPSRKVQPGFDFDYTLPLGKKFGIVVTGMHSRKFNPNDFVFPTWNTGGVSTGASITAPYLQSYRVSKTLRDQRRRTLSFKADWRVTPHSVLTFGLNWNDLATYAGGVNFIPSVGTNGTPTPATGRPLSFGPDFSSGATGRAAITLSANNGIFFAESLTPRLGFRFDNGAWTVDASLSESKATRERPRARDMSDFFGMSATLNAPGSNIVFSDITEVRPGRIQLFNAAGQELDLNDLSNYRLASATETVQYITTRVQTGSLNARRRLASLSFPASLQIGGFQRFQSRDSRGEQRAYTNNGVGGDLSPKPYAFQSWVNQDAGFGFKNIPAYSVSRAYDAWLATPALFTQTAAQIRASEAYRLTNSEYMKETVTAGYVQAEANLLANRLKVLAGIRWEETVGDGIGSRSDPEAVWQRNANGTFARNAQGARIRRPEAGAVNSLEELALIQQERAAAAHSSYDDFFPSVHLTYEIKENFLLRAAFAQTYARPDFANIIPRTIINENDLNDEQLVDPSTVRGRITMRNTALQPWTADNYDLSLEYYTEHGGVFSAGVFLKDIKNFFGDAVRLATPADLERLGLDPRYVGWDLVTQFNSGDARISGVEFNVRHSLRALGSWGRYFTAFANATKLDLDGDRDADFGNYVPEGVNWGFTFSRKAITFTARWNYVGEQRGDAAPAFGPDAYAYSSAATMLDLNFAYQLSRRFSLNTTFNNVTDTRDNRYSYGSQTPKYARITQARNYGMMMGVSLRGTF